MLIIFFKPIYDKIEEYLKRYQNLFDQEICEFFSSDIPEQQIEEKILNKCESLDPQDKYYEARKKYWEIKKKDIDSVFSMKMSRKKASKNSIKDKERKTKEEEQNPKTKFIIEFDSSLACNIKCLAVKTMKH